MAEQVEIQAVAPQHQMRALEFLLGGNRCDLLVASRAESLHRLVSGPAGRRATLLWARRAGACVAAAMVVHNPGRAGMLLYSPPGAPGVDIAALVAVIRAAWRQGLEAGLLLVQAMVDQGRDDDRAVLKSAGLDLLATLIHMRQSLPVRRDSAGNGLRWRSRDQYDQRELERVIAESYKGSLDCPALAGVRRVGDAIECHKASGIYRPQSWWIVYLERIAAGCVLMNDCASSDGAEIVYLGVVPSCRGRGLGRAMLRHAAADAHGRGLRAIELAVDEANVYAKRLYDSEGYRTTRRQWAYIVFHPGAKSAAS